MIQDYTTSRASIFEIRLKETTKEQATREADRLYMSLTVNDRRTMDNCFICKAYPDDEIDERHPNWDTMTNICYYKRTV